MSADTHALAEERKARRKARCKGKATRGTDAADGNDVTGMQLPSPPSLTLGVAAADARNSRASSGSAKRDKGADKADKAAAAKEAPASAGDKGDVVSPTTRKARGCRGNGASKLGDGPGGGGAALGAAAPRWARRRPSPTASRPQSTTRSWLRAPASRA